MTTSNRPMLAEKLTPAQYTSISYPKLASYKLDGIRCRIVPGVGPLTRSGKLLPNLHTRVALNHPHLVGFDGELLADVQPGVSTMSAAQTAFMTIQGKPKFTFNVFDDTTNPGRPFHARLRQAYERIISPIETNRAWMPEWVNWLNHVEIKDAIALEYFEAEAIVAGYEGIIVRHPEASYKHGRSTLREQGMLKVKRFTDGEAIIRGLIALQHNANADVRSELGYAKRATNQENMVTLPQLGAFEVEELVDGEPNGVYFEIGTGFTSQQRYQFWSEGISLVSRIVKFKHQAFGRVEKPRIPVFLGFRAKEDL